MSSAEPERKAFKDYFDRAAAEALADQMRGAWRRFDRGGFIAAAGADLEPLSFQQRVQQFSDALAAFFAARAEGARRSGQESSRGAAEL